MSFSYKIEPEWNILKNIKESIENDPAITSRGPDFLDATRMTALELTENALKYSDRSHPVEISLDLSGKECVIRITNNCNNPDMIEALFKMLKKLKEGDPFELYVDRLQQLKDHPDGYSRMGMLRIVYEGEFKLDGEIDGDRVTLTARRDLN